MRLKEKKIKTKTDIKAELLARWLKRHRIPLMFVDRVFYKAKLILEENAK